MQIIVIAIGQEHEERAAKIKTRYPSAVVVTSLDLLQEHQHAKPAIAARLAKSGFASYIPEGYSGPVCLLDSDVVIRTGAFDQLPELTTGIAGVAVQGVETKCYLPAPYLGQHMIGALNSGVLFFPTVPDATAISSTWHARYLAQYETTLRDEFALYFALRDLDSTVQYLDERFNSTNQATGLFLHGKMFQWETQTVPGSIANWRAKAVIEIAGLTSQVEAALAAMQGPEGIVARAAWNGNADFDRNGATVTALAEALGLTSEQVDSMFVQAAGLSV